ncbi:MAG: hypothetical protein M1531_12680 [Chloroflexi bacterium]|nr:hypothetical protein [Chloroflexota bacterium]
MATMERERRKNAYWELPARTEIAALLVVALLIASYSMLRYGGLWGEADTNVFSAASWAALETGRLAEGPEQAVYPNGYGYQAVATFLANIAGLTVPAMQLYGSALLMVWIVVPAWLLYREFIGSKPGATLATAILLVQPELLFPVLRGTHEKFTRGLILLCLYLLVRSLHSRHRPSRFAALVLAYYLAIFALISFNNLLATSFIMVVGLALGLSWLVFHGNRSAFPSMPPAIRRLSYTLLVSIVLTFLFIFYAYTPARHDLLVLWSFGDQLAAWFSGIGGTEKVTSIHPYTAVDTGWVSLPVYFTLSLANWLLLLGSGAIWLWQSIAWMRPRKALGDEATSADENNPGPLRVWLWRGTSWLRRSERESDLLLWAFYGAFAFQVIVSIALDVSGALTSNLQHRAFPSFTMLAAPVAGKWLAEQMPWQAVGGRLAQAALWMGIAVLGVLSVLKSTNEPLLSNKWLFYLPGEVAAIEWAADTLSQRALWSGFDERMATSIGIRYGIDPRKVRLTMSMVDAGVRDFLVSDVIRRQSLRLSMPLPVEGDSLITYDNGQAQIQHRRPRTPFQR